PADLIMFDAIHCRSNVQANKNFNENIFSSTRQLRYYKSNKKLALDLAIFINGLPVITCELKNNLTNQSVKDAIYQYRYVRDPKELIFAFKRSMVHFAIDENEIQFCTELTGESSWFLPFNKGHRGGAGNPPNPDGVRTDYLWKTILTKGELANII